MPIGSRLEDEEEGGTLPAGPTHSYTRPRRKAEYQDVYVPQGLLPEC